MLDANGLKFPKNFNFPKSKNFWQPRPPFYKLISRKQLGQDIYLNISLESPLHKHSISIIKVFTRLSGSKAMLDANAHESPKIFYFLNFGFNLTFKKYFLSLNINSYNCLRLM
jgi:hypothetical protein